MAQTDIVEKVDEVGACLCLEKPAKGRLGYVHQFGGFAQPYGPAEVGIHKFDELFHADAIHVDIVGVVYFIPRETAGPGVHGQFVQNGHQLDDGVETRLVLQFLKAGGEPADRLR